MEEESIPTQALKQLTTSFQDSCSTPLQQLYEPRTVGFTENRVGANPTSTESAGLSWKFGDNKSSREGIGKNERQLDTKLQPLSDIQAHQFSNSKSSSTGQNFTANRNALDLRTDESSEIQSSANSYLHTHLVTKMDSATKSHLPEISIGTIQTQDAVAHLAENEKRKNVRVVDTVILHERHRQQELNGPENQLAVRTDMEDSIIIDVPFARKSTETPIEVKQIDQGAKPKFNLPSGILNHESQLPSRTRGIFNSVVQHQTSLSNLRDGFSSHQLDHDSKSTNKSHQEPGYVNWSKPSNQQNNGSFKAVTVSVLETKTRAKPEPAVSALESKLDSKIPGGASSARSVTKSMSENDQPAKFATPNSRSKQEQKLDNQIADEIISMIPSPLKNSCYCGKSGKNNEEYLTCANYARCQGRCHKSCVDWSESDYGPFECPSCLILNNDPMREVVTPLIGPTYLEPEATYSFRVVLPKPAPPPQGRGKALPVPMYDVEMRCIKLGGPRMYIQCWPQNIKLTLNSTNIFDSIYMDQTEWYKPGREAPRLRNLVPNINTVMRSNNFTLKVESVSDLNTRYMFCVCLVRSHCLRSFYRKIGTQNTLEMREAQKKLLNLMFGSQAPNGSNFDQNRPKNKKLL